MYYTDPITGVIVIESSPEPDPEPKPVKSNGGRKKKSVIKPPVPLYAEIRKMQWLDDAVLHTFPGCVFVCAMQKRLMTLCF